MTVALRFNDTVTLYEVRRSGYGRLVPQEPVEVPAIYEQNTARGHASNQDFISSAGRLYLPGDDPFVVSKGQRLEGLVVEVNVFGFEESKQHFKITQVSPYRDTLLGNEIQHVECGLEKVENFDASEDN